MTQILTALFDTFADAKAAAHRLEAIGVGPDDIALVAHGEGEGLERLADDTGKGAGLGALIGGAGALFASLGLVAIPGVGPALALGWLAAMATGAAVGGAAGGLVGALVNSGVAEHDAHAYAESVRRGGALLTARVSDSELNAARAELAQSVDIGQRASLYRQKGWTVFDAAAAPLDRKQLESEHASHIFL